MTPNKPYLVRAFFDWIVDNDCTPHVVVNAMAVGVEVPQVYVTDGQVVLNLAPRAVTAFHLDNEALSFNTRFGGVPTDIFVPIHAIIGIYARENGEGMAFEASTQAQVEPAPAGLKSVEDDPSDKPPRGPAPTGSKPSGPQLRVVK
ncbi:ClpXP protease specificity-enhancing factor [Gammaproteobacteria bacterium 53_120_T64]|nr:ClpXP protease specificity-enhancing factor [Gammaproteobacteria bacterium 53_120_T64]